MHFQSHLMIGNVVFKIIRENFGFNLSSISLLYGCVKPDISPILINIPHYKEKSFPFISEMIINVQNLNFPENQREMGIFSRNLGIILHYIADYFCIAHNHKDRDNFSEHFKYEMILNSHMKKYIASSLHIQSMGLSIEDQESLENSLLEYILRKHERYLNEMPSPLIDIKYSIEVSCILAMSIITSVIVNGYSQVA